MATIKDLSENDIAKIKARINRGEKYSEIASDYRINQGRIADLKFGRIRPDVSPADSPPPAAPAQKSLF
jgi:hypothetical protein